LDEGVIAERKARGLNRKSREVAKSAAKTASLQAAQDSKAAEAAAIAAMPPPPTEAS
jgi:hypothetical protein